MVWIIGALIIAAIVGMVVWRGLQMKALANKGVVAQGRVVKKFRKQHGRGAQSAPYLRYEFKTAAGQLHQRSVVVSEEVFGSHEEGDVFDVVYLQRSPDVNGARYMVNLSRKALNLPPL